MSNKETGRCQWCGDVVKGACGCPATAEIARLARLVKADAEEKLTEADRELLELAAKAAGLINARYREATGGDYNSGTCILHDTENGRSTHGWNPLTDDGDALRLAVKLGVIIGTYASYSTVDLLSPNDRIETVTVWHSETSGNHYAATRRAIVRAAAEIGRAIK